MIKRILVALLLILAIDWAPGIPPYPLHSLPSLAIAQVGIDGLPPNRFHPYKGGKNCIQVVDANSNFNCAAGTTVDPATGNLVIGGSITFGSGGASLAPGGLALTTSTSVQLLGAGDLVIQSSPSTVAPGGPLINGVTFRVRSVAGGQCMVVVAGGNGMAEYAIPVIATQPLLALNPASPYVNAPDRLQMLYYFPGGPSGC